MLEFIEAQPTPLQVAIFRSLERIEAEGLRASGVSFRQVRGKLWEIRVMSGGSVRVFYVARSAEDMVLLHAYKKQSQKAPAREVALAERRMREVME